MLTETEDVENREVDLFMQKVLVLEGRQCVLEGIY